MDILFPVFPVSGLVAMGIIASAKIRPPEVEENLVENVAAQYTTLAVPFYLTLIAAELLYERAIGKSTYNFGEALASLGTGILNQSAEVFKKGAFLILYAALYPLHIFDIPLESVGAWIFVFLWVEAAGYWNHRLHHEVNVFWGIHEVHHSSEDYNLVTALRQAFFNGLLNYPLVLPLAIFGFPVLMVTVVYAFSILYQFWIHTQHVPSLGIFDWFFNSPSNHRVHHGKNAHYIDKNYGYTIMLYDHLFGTYQKEDEPVRYGITQPVLTLNPVLINTHYFALLNRWSRGRGFWGRLKILFQHPARTDKPGETAQELRAGGLYYRLRSGQSRWVYYLAVQGIFFSAGADFLFSTFPKCLWE